jgi:hypothetical protein
VAAALKADSDNDMPEKRASQKSPIKTLKEFWQ